MDHSFLGKLVQLRVASFCNQNPVNEPLWVFYVYHSNFGGILIYSLLRWTRCWLSVNWFGVFYDKKTILELMQHHCYNAKGIRQQFLLITITARQICGWIRSKAKKGFQGDTEKVYWGNDSSKKSVFSRGLKAKTGFTVWTFVRRMFISSRCLDLS